LTDTVEKNVSSDGDSSFPRQGIFQTIKWNGRVGQIQWREREVPWLPSLQIPPWPCLSAIYTPLSKQCHPEKLQYDVRNTTLSTRGGLSHC